MRNSHRAVTLISLSCILAPVACIEPFVPEPSLTGGVLVVDGLISDAEGPYVVNLTRSAPLNSDAPTPEEGASVSVHLSEGAEYPFAEVSPGIYQSSPAEFIGVVGATYTLNITASDGKKYSSTPEVLKRVPLIDSVYFEPSVRLADITADTITGVAILVDTHDPQNATTYYRWEWEEAWEIKVPYPNRYDWEIWPVLTPTFERFGYEIYNDRKVEMCYSSGVSSGLLLGSSVGLVHDRISKFELNYVSTEGYKLNSVYSIKVRQYALDEKEYRYWVELEKLSELLGTLFDPQPYDLRGNLYSVSDPDLPVLGYFSASAIDQKRIFIPRNELNGIQYPESKCAQELVFVENKFVQNHIEAGYLIAYLGDYGSGGYFMAPANCCDCTYHGTLETPDFWP